MTYRRRRLVRLMETSFGLHSISILRRASPMGLHLATSHIAQRLAKELFRHDLKPHTGFAKCPDTVPQVKTRAPSIKAVAFLTRASQVDPWKCQMPIKPFFSRRYSSSVDRYGAHFHLEQLSAIRGGHVSANLQRLDRMQRSSPGPYHPYRSIAGGGAACLVLLTSRRRRHFPTYEATATEG